MDKEPELIEGAELTENGAVKIPIKGFDTRPDIYNQTVSILELVHSISEFFCHCHPGEADGNDKAEVFTYGDCLLEAGRKGPTGGLKIDVDDIDHFSSALATTLHENPFDFRVAMTTVIREILNSNDLNSDIWPEFKNCSGELIKISKIQNHNVGKLNRSIVDIEQESQPAIYYKVKHFLCGAPEHHPNNLSVNIFEQNKEPRGICRVGNCRDQNFEFIPEKSSYFVAQWVRIRDSRDSNHCRRAIDPTYALLMGSLAGIHATKNVLIHAVPKFAVQSNKQRGGPPTNFLYLDIYGLEIQEQKGIQISEEEVQQIKELAKRPDIIEILSRSICPALDGWGMIKRALLIQAIGCPEIESVGGVDIRNTIHTFLLGDPGTGKTDLLKFIARVVPNSVFASGEGTTAAGFSYAVLDDKLTGRPFIEPGVLAIADGSIACVDEFNELKPEDINKGKTALESGYMTVDKWGEHEKLAARTSLLAAANPKYGDFDLTMAPSRQYSFPAPVNSRIDIKMAMVDTPSTEKGGRDERLFKSSFDRWLKELPREHSGKEYLSEEMLGKYIWWTRQNIQSKLSEGLRDSMVSSALQGRQAYLDGQKFTMRQFQTRMRLALAFARARHSEIAENIDVDRTLDLLATADASMNDPVLRPNMDSYADPEDRHLTERELVLARVQSLGGHGFGAKDNELLLTLEKEGLTQERTSHWLRVLTMEKRISKQGGETWFLCH